jgi:hypothetical protein
MKRHLSPSLTLIPFLLFPPLQSQAANRFFAGVDTAFSLSYSNPPVDDTFTVTSETKRLFGARSYVGYQITPKFNIELGLTHRTNYKQTAVNQFASYDANAKIVNKDVMLSYFPTEQLAGLYLLTGMAWTEQQIRADATIFGIKRNADSNVNFRHYILGLGYEGTITDNVHWRVMYARYGKEKLTVFGLKYLFGG